MEKESLTYKTLKNSGYGLFGFFWTFAFSIFITPIIVFSLGVRDYGVFIFINSIISLVGLLDLGISFSTQKYITEYHHKGDKVSLKKLVGSANTFFLIIGVIGFLIIATIGVVGCHFFKCTLDTNFSYSLLFLIGGLIFFVDSINSTFNFTLPALQRFDIYTKIGVSKNTAQQITMLFLVLAGYSLFSIFLATLFYSIIFCFITMKISNRILPEIKLAYAIDKDEMKKIYKFGISYSINNLSNTSLISLDKFIIPIILGPSRLTYYSLPGGITGKVPAVIDKFSTVLFPISTELHTSGDKEKLTRVYKRIYRMIFVLSASMTISIILFAEKIMRFWLDESFVKESTTVLIVLAATAFLLSLHGFFSQFLYGIERLKEVTITSMSMALINIVLLLILLPRFDILGAAWAYVLSFFPIFYLQFVIEKKYLNIQNSFKNNFYLYLKIIITALPFSMIYIYIIGPIILNFVSLLILGPISVLIFLLLFRVFGFFEKEDVNAIMTFIKKLPNKS